MAKQERRAIGAHYTTEANILKVLDSVMLDDLRAELEQAKRSRSKLELEQFVAKLGEIRVFDPACGCGDFLVIAYRELRRIEIEAVKSGQLNRVLRVHVGQFFGIEIEEFPAQIARVALWLADQHEALRASAELGEIRLPLAAEPTILNDNALVVDWKSVVAPDRLVFIVGNPPFIGKKEQTPAQKADMKRVFPKLAGVGKLDYVACWFMKAARYAENNAVSIAFVATSSITQGEQVGILWEALFELGVKINFAHRTFQWTSEAKGQAVVHCVIIGFARAESTAKVLFEYATPKSEPEARKVDGINAYLVDGPNVLLHDRSSPIGKGPKVTYGSFALDDGQYTLDPHERSDLLSACPAAEKFIRPFVGGAELIHAKQRFCLWLVDATPSDLDAMPQVTARVAHVQAWRAKRNRPGTKTLAATPTRFAEIRQPTTNYLAFPTLSSEYRAYIPIGFLEPSTIASNQVYVFAGATSYHFGILTSDAHMTWVRAVCGRLESRYRYSAGIVYNNFPWPEPSAKQRAAIELAAQSVLDARAVHPQTTLGQLYDKLTMPADLEQAHSELDVAVYAAYGISARETEAKRAAGLLALHETLAGRHVRGNASR